MENNKKFFSLQMMVEGGIMLALAYVLNMFKLYTMPQGGDISLSMLPIMIFAIRWGGLPGFILGALYGILKLIVEPYVIHPAQLILDYPLPSAFVGLSGISFLTIGNTSSIKISHPLPKQLDHNIECSIL